MLVVGTLNSKLQSLPFVIVFTFYVPIKYLRHKLKKLCNLFSTNCAVILEIK